MYNYEGCSKSNAFWFYDWPTVSEADVGGMTVEDKPFHQHSVRRCCCATDGSRGAVWQNGAWHGSVYEGKVCNWIPPCGKNCTHWNSPVLTEHLLSLNTGSEHSEEVSDTFQQWHRSICETVGHLHWCYFCKHGMHSCSSLVKMHS